MGRFNYYGSVADQRRRNLAIVTLGMIFSISLTGLAILLLKHDRAEAKTAEFQAAAQSAARPDPDTIEVLIPNSDLEPNQLLEERMFRKASWPKQYSSAATVKSFEEVKGKFAKSFIAAGQPLHSAYITTQRGSSPISPLIPKGYRAVTIRVNDVSSVDGMVRPGEFVDVSFHHILGDQKAIIILVERASVVGADKQVEGSWRPGMPAPGTVTLLLTSDDTQKVQLAEASGTLSLALRNATDLEPMPRNPVTLKEILRKEEQKDPSTSCQGTITIRSKNGVSSEKMCLTDSGEIVPRVPESVS
ncbi:MAG: Flp pilus assembly protein CpaB [Proteobacteria bacterium]|nr:MAG: Flp pilus assembly protein CpaB [Pseudomonadota bacterium]